MSIWTARAAVVSLLPLSVILVVAGRPNAGGQDAKEPKAAPERSVAPARLPARVDAARVGILVIDPQPSFVAIMANDAEAVNARLEQLYVFADLAQLPLITTFERPVSRNGSLSERLEKVFPAHGKRFEKNFFDCCRESEIRKALESSGRTQFAVAGAETDVCVLQSVLGLLSMGFEVFVLEDCLFSNEKNAAPALERMYAAGAIPSTFKTFYFEVVRHVGRHEEDERSGFTERWKRLKPVMKDPYDLPPHPAR